jgi:hypothetical protein
MVSAHEQCKLALRQQCTTMQSTQQLKNRVHEMKITNASADQFGTKLNPNSSTT